MENAYPEIITWIKNRIFLMGIIIAVKIFVVNAVDFLFNNDCFVCWNLVGGF